MTLPFDRIVLHGPMGEQWLSLAEFEALPLTERLRALFEGRLQFFRGRTPVDTQAALQALRSAAAGARRAT